MFGYVSTENLHIRVLRRVIVRVAKPWRTALIEGVSRYHACRITNGIPGKSVQGSVSAFNYCPPSIVRLVSDTKKRWRDQ